MNIEFVETLPERLVEIVKSLDIVKIDLDFTINEYGEILCHPSLKVIVKGDPNQMSHKDFLSLEDFCYTNKISYLDLESVEEVPDPYEPSFTEPEFKTFIEGKTTSVEKDTAYTIYLEMEYEDKKLLKNLESYSCNTNKKDKASQIAFNNQLEKLKSLGYENTDENKEEVMTDFDYKEIRNIVKDKRLYEEVRNDTTVIEDTEVSLYVEKSKVRVNLCHIGHNFNWNNLQKIDDYEIPISYSIIDKKWSLNSPEGYQYRIIQEKQKSEPSEIYSLFSGALDFEEMKRYSTPGLKRLVLNKGKVFSHKEIGYQHYFFNKYGYVIYSTDKRNVLDADKTKESINTLLDKIFSLN